MPSPIAMQQRAVANLLVSPSDSEALIDSIARRTADPQAGVFGPNSLAWKINRESALFLGAGRATLLQLAHPWVATAIAEHSNVLADPIARFHNTFRIVFAMIFGSVDQAARASRHLYRLHSRVRGELTEDVAAYRKGSRYEANEISALRWVYATLIDTAVLAYEWVLPPLEPKELEGYYEETKLLAALFGLPASELPDRWTDFLAYCRQMERSTALGVTEQARVTAHRVLAGAGSWIRPPRWYRSLTVEWLPPQLRDGFRLEYGTEDAHAVERARTWFSGLYRRLPAGVRFVGPWHEAQARLRGRPPGIFARASNRFWIGDTHLPFAD